MHKQNFRILPSYYQLNSLIPEHILYLYILGTTAQALVEGVAGVTRGAIKGRFFHFYPQRDVELMKWLGHWMKKGN